MFHAKKKSTILFATILLCLLVQLSCFGSDPKDLVNKSAPQISGVEWLSSSQSFPVKNKVNLVIFWNSKYKSSVDALEAVQNLYNTYGSKGLVAIGINDSAEAKSVLSLIAGQKGIKFPLGTGSGATKAAAAYDLKGVPAVFLVNKSGTIVYVVEGYTSNFESNLSQRIQALL